MNRIIPFGLAAALLMSTAVTAMADNNGNGEAENDVAVETEVQVDPDVTGAIGAMDHSVAAIVSGIETGAGTQVDLTAFGPGSTITCVTVSELDGADNTAALDVALTEHDDPLAVLRGQIQAHPEFMTELQAACDLQFQSEDIVSARALEGGNFVVYIDDREGPLVTGAIGTAAHDPATYGGLVESLRSGVGLTPDRTALGEPANIRCIALSDLEGMQDGTATLDAALGAQQEQLALFRADVDAQPEFMNQLRADCPQFIDITAEQLLSIHTDAGGEFIVYVDDRT